MTNKQEDILTMLYRLSTVIELFKSIWTTNKAFSATASVFHTLLSAINADRDVQIAKDNSSSVKKKALRESNIEDCLYFSNRLQSYAHATSNTILANKAKVTRSELNMARDTTIIGKWNNILNLVVENIRELADYDVDETRVESYRTGINSYESIVTEPSNEASKNSSVTKNLEKNFKDIMDLLDNRMDLDIEVFKTSNFSFWEQYQQARLVKSTGRSTYSVIGAATSKNSGEKLKNVVFIFTPQGAINGKAESIEKRTAEKGSFRLTGLSEGVYRVTISKTGYKTQSQSITITNEGTFTLNVELEKE
jgi:hypothetical protein